MKKILQIFILIICTLCIMTIFTSCAKIGLMSSKSSSIPIDIDSFGEFFRVFLRLQISMLLIGLILSLALDRLGSVISTLLHFIWVVSYRDYGFIIVLLLFVGGSIIIYLSLPLIMFLVSAFKNFVNKLLGKDLKSEE